MDSIPQKQLVINWDKDAMKPPSNKCTYPANAEKGKSKCRAYGTDQGIQAVDGYNFADGAGAQI